MHKNKEILTPKEVGEILGIGKAKLYALLRSENFPVLTLGKLKRVSRVELENWIRNNSYKKGDN